MILAVRPFNDKVLHTVGSPLANPCEGLDVLIPNMWETMTVNKGIGLAANQVGFLLRVFVASLENRTNNLVVINPKVLSTSKEKTIETEGCLSALGMTVQVKRYKKLLVEFETFPTRELVTMEFTDMDARIIQHELDHLNGKMIVSHLCDFTQKK